MEKRYNYQSPALTRAGLAAMLFLFLLIFHQPVLSQTFIASDNAAAYGGTWNNGDDEGYGFGPWNISVGAGTGFAGVFTGNPSDAGITDLPDPSFGLFANPAGSGAFVNADRNLAFPLPVGGTLSFQWGVNRDSEGAGNKGVNLYVGGTAGTQLININQGGSAVITINGSAMFSNFGTQAMTLHFERVSATQLRVYGTGRDGTETYDNTFTLAGSAIDALRFYASELAGGDNRQPYFNNIRITFPQNHTLSGDIDVSAIDITTGTQLDAGANSISLAPDGFFRNSGSFTAGSGSVIFTGNATVEGPVPVTFYRAVVDAGDGNGVNFGDGISTVQNVLEMRSGFVASHAAALAEGSTLLYATGGSYVREIEWNNPRHVQLANETLLNLNLNEWNGDITIAGNLTIDENAVLTLDDGTGAWDIILEGDLFLNGQLSLSGSFGRDMQIRGNWNQTGTFNANTREVIFNGIGVQNILHNISFDYLRIANPGGEVVLHDGLSVASRLEVDPNATFNMRHHIVSGSGIFNLRDAATLKIGHPQGINTLANSGNVQVADARNFATSATYHYVGQENQFSGNALPLNSAKTLIVELGEDEYTLGINTSDLIQINSPGRLEIRRGTLVESASFAQGRSVSGNGDLVMTGGVFRFERTLTENSDIRFPRLNGDFLLTGGTVELAGNTNSPNQIQILRGSRTYHNVRISGISSGGGYKTHSNPITVNEAFKINGDNVFDADNRALAGPGRLIMDSGLLRISKVTNVQPELTGDYLLTGGTIEFGGSGASAQTVRGNQAGRNRVYHNIVISGTNVANSSGSYTIGQGGSFRILNDARFQINTVAIEGPGHFELEAGGTLAYGSEYGITEASCGSGTACGNVRTTTRNFSPGANYELMGNSSPQQTGSALPLMMQNLVINKGEQAYEVLLTREAFVADKITLVRGKLITQGNALTLGNSNFDALVAGTGNENFFNSFIIGPFTRGLSQIGENYIFPVGRTEGPQTLTLNFNEDDTEFTGAPTVKVNFSTVRPDNYYGNLPQVFDGVLINTLSEDGYWSAEPQNIISARYTLSLFARDFGGINMPDGIRIVKRQDSNDDWVMAGENASWSGANLMYVFTQENVDGFSEFALGANIFFNPLPVDWLSFTATRQAGDVLLHWQTATEINNDYFTVLRSHNGTDFYPLTTLAGAGNSNQMLSYTYVDNHPQAGINYYRIRQTDFDGKTDYSKTLALDLKAFSEPEIYYSNQTIHINIPSQAHPVIWLYRLTDLQGRVLMQGTAEVSSAGWQHSIPVAAGHHRVLLFSLGNGDQIYSVKIPII